MKALLTLLLLLLPTTLATNLTLHPSTTAFLHLDLLTILIEAFVLPFPSGQTFLASEIHYLNTLHALSPAPLNIFTRLYFSRADGTPELGPSSPFYAVASPLLPLLETTPGTAIYPAIPVSANDTTITKVRYYAGSGNALEVILKTQGITTVVLSGVRTSGVVLTTALRLFDLDYDVVVVKDCTLETPVGAQGAMIQEAILGKGGVVEKLGAQVVELGEVVAALAGWGD